MKEIVPAMDQIIKLLDVIIWPSLVLILFIMLRKPIKSLLPFVENIKYKDFEVKFRLDQLKEEAKEAGIDLQTHIGEKQNYTSL